MKDSTAEFTFALRLSRSAGGLVVIMEHDTSPFTMDYKEELLTGNSFGWHLEGLEWTPSLPALLKKLRLQPLPRPEKIVVMYGDHNQAIMQL